MRPLHLIIKSREKNFLFFNSANNHFNDSKMQKLSFKSLNFYISKSIKKMAKMHFIYTKENVSSGLLRLDMKIFPA